MSRYGSWLYYFLLAEGGVAVKPLDAARIFYKAGTPMDGIYNLDWKDSERRKEHFLRRDSRICQLFLKESVQRSLPLGLVSFDYTNSGRKISYWDTAACKSGWLMISKLTNQGFDKEEHLLIAALDDCGKKLDANLINRIMELPAFVQNMPEEKQPASLEALMHSLQQTKLQEIEDANKKYPPVSKTGIGTCNRCGG